MGMNEFHKYGLAVLRNVFTEEVKHVRSAMEFVFRNYTKKNDPFDEMLYELFQNDFEGFHGCAMACQNVLEIVRLSSSEKMQRILNNLGLNKPIVNTRPLVSFSSPKLAKHETYWKVPAHQDWPSMQGSINAVTCWMPLFDVSDEMGPLEFAPGTHMLGPIGHEDVKVPVITQDDYSYIQVKLNAGDAVWFSPFTVHRSGNNVSNKIRWSMHFRYDDAAEETFTQRKYPHHRIDKRKEGILHPGFPTQQLLKEYYDKFCREQEV